MSLCTKTQLRRIREGSPKVGARQRARQRGTAMVEAVIALPIFVLLFAGLFHVEGLSSAKRAQTALVRRCAWAYAMNNCTEVPEGCGDVVSVGKSETMSHQQGSIRNGLKSGIDGLVGGATVKEAIGKVVISALLPAVEDAFGRRVNASSSTERETPMMFGGKNVTLSASYHLACNLKPTDPLELAGDVWEIFSP